MVRGLGCHGEQEKVSAEDLCRRGDISPWNLCGVAGVRTPLHCPGRNGASFRAVGYCTVGFGKLHRSIRINLFHSFMVLV